MTSILRSTLYRFTLAYINGLYIEHRRKHVERSPIDYLVTFYCLYDE